MMPGRMLQLLMRNAALPTLLSGMETHSMRLSPVHAPHLQQRSVMMIFPKSHFVNSAG
jgi:hypothetical protein